MSVSTDRQTVWTGSGLSKSDVNKLLSFSEDPEKYATGTGRAKAKVEYLDYLAGLKHQFSEDQLSTYIKAREKYDAATAIREVELNAPKVDCSNTLAEAFNNQRSVKIQYKGSWRTIDPYSINSTYVVAYCHFAHDIRTFRIDRIQGAELLGSFTPDRSLLGSAKSKLMEAPSYKYRHKH